jgi:hypothetical protein
MLADYTADDISLCHLPAGFSPIGNDCEPDDSYSSDCTPTRRYLVWDQLYSPHLGDRQSIPMPTTLVASFGTEHVQLTLPRMTAGGFHPRMENPILPLVSGSQYALYAPTIEDTPR